MLNLHIGLVLAPRLNACRSNAVCASIVFVSGIRIVLDPFVMEQSEEDAFRATDGEFMSQSIFGDTPAAR